MAAKFCEIFTLFLTGTTYDKIKMKTLQNFVAFSEYMNFNRNVEMRVQKVFDPRTMEVSSYKLDRLLCWGESFGESRYLFCS